MSNETSPQDDNDPFIYAGEIVPITKKNNVPIPPFDRMSALELGLCLAIGKRASMLIAQHARDNPEKNIVVPHPAICACDVAVAHLAQPLDLHRFFSADNLTFTPEFVQIARHIDRVANFFPTTMPLKFRKTA
jgi:hypothetical protein